MTTSFEINLTALDDYELLGRFIDAVQAADEEGQTTFVTSKSKQVAKIVPPSNWRSTPEGTERFDPNNLHLGVGGH